LDCSAPETVERVDVTFAAGEETAGATLFRYAPDTGWTRVAQQQYDASAGIVRAEAPLAETYVLCRIQSGPSAEGPGSDAEPDPDEE
jgi:hypothetical protein